MEKEKEFEEFFKAHYQHARHFARQMIGDEETCRDIVEDSFEILWKRFNGIEPDKRIAFIFRLIRFRCADHVRHSQTTTLYAQRYLQEQSEATNPHAADPREERINKMMTLMDQLSPKTREILTECYFNHHSYNEVAEKYGISTSAVKKHMMQALKFFRENMVKESKKSDQGVPYHKVFPIRK